MVLERGVAAATICNGLNVGNDPLNFRKAELDGQTPLIFGPINNLEEHASPKHFGL
jgi:hypothetical protein